EGGELPGGAPAPAGEHREAHDEHQQDEHCDRGCLPHAGTSSSSGTGSARAASSTVGRPRRNVATTRPGRTRPRKGVFRPAVAIDTGSMVRLAAGSTRTTFAGAP